MSTAPETAREPQGDASEAGVELPLPPLELRRLVGPTDPDAFDNPSGDLIYPELDVSLYEAIFDFGCGCGRVARQLMLQRQPPQRYLGIDVHRGMIEWCQRNLAPVDPKFQFSHHDVRNPLLNPDGSADAAVFPAPEETYSLVIAHSVFTHLVEWQAEHYLRECARILAPHGVVNATWFLFDKADFPMLDEDSNALYIRYDDPTAAVLFDRGWVRSTAAAAGLEIVRVEPPVVHGHQWRLLLAHAGGREGQ